MIVVQFPFLLSLFQPEEEGFGIIISPSLQKSISKLISRREMGTYHPKSIVETETPPPLPTSKILNLEIVGDKYQYLIEKNNQQHNLEVTFLSRVGFVGESEIEAVLEEEVRKVIQRPILTEELTIEREKYTCTFRVIY
jgi:hypothetical protein